MDENKKASLFVAIDLYDYLGIFKIVFSFFLLFK